MISIFIYAIQIKSHQCEYARQFLIKYDFQQTYRPQTTSRWNHLASVKNYLTYIAQMHAIYIRANEN